MNKQFLCKMEVTSGIQTNLCLPCPKYLRIILRTVSEYLRVKLSYSFKFILNNQKKWLQSAADALGINKYLRGARSGAAGRDKEAKGRKELMFWLQFKASAWCG